MSVYKQYCDIFKKQPSPDSVKGRKNAYFRAIPEICIERASLVTKYHLQNDLLGKDKISVLDKARVYHFVQSNRTPVVWHTTAAERTADGTSQTFALEKDLVDESPLAGSTTSKFKGVPLFPEFLAQTIWPELYSISRREANPLYLDTETARDNGLTDAETLDREILPYWMDHSIMELARMRFEKPNAQNSSPLFEKMLYFVFFTTTKTACISHTIPSFQRVIYEGLEALIDEANEHCKAAHQLGDAEQADFYQALSIALDGILVYGGRVAKKAEEMAVTEKSARRRALLKEIAARYRRVPKGPATSFRDGVTALWVCWTSLHQENQNMAVSLGRLDQLFAPLLERDLSTATDKKKVLDDARELLCHLWLKIGDHVPMMPEDGEQLYGGTGSNQAITIGGVNFDEAAHEAVDAVNDLTYLIIDSIEMMKLRDPNLNARVHAGKNDADYLRRLGLANLRTGATPAIHNDEAIIPALINNGLAPAHAHDFGIVGCVEPVSAGRHFGHTGSVLINLPAVLECTLYNGRHRHTNIGGKDLIVGAETGNPRTFKTFAELYAAFEKQIDKMVDDVVTLNNWLGKTHQAFYPTPTLSALFEGPMKKGRDVTMGGATYNSSGVTIIGLADTADSLAAMQEVVFAGGKNRVDELIRAIEVNFDKEQGFEPLRKMLGQKERRYGREGSVGTSFAVGLTQKLADAFGKQENYRGGPYRVGYFTMTSHTAFGWLSGATPNGRYNAQPFASGITPVSDTPESLTGTLLAVSSLPATALSNGVALNISFDATKDQDAALDRFEQYVKGYFGVTAAMPPIAKKKAAAIAARGAAQSSNAARQARFAATAGGVEIQFNMMGRKKLLAALKDPKPELLVRVSGYTAYFKDLNKRMKREIIERTQYGFAEGQVIPIKPSQKKQLEEGEEE